MYPKEGFTQVKCKSTLFTIKKKTNWKQALCPPTAEQINIHTKEYHAAIKTKEPEGHTTKQIIQQFNIKWKKEP